MKLKSAIALFLVSAFLFLLSSCLGAEGPIAAPEEGEVRVSFLDVGQADCAVIRTADRVIVVDTGHATSDGTELLTYLGRLGIKRIDLLVLTHPHEDHIGGAPSVLREYDVVECLMTDLLADSVLFRETVAALKNEGCTVTRAHSDVVRAYGDLSVEVLSPTNQFSSTVNDAGIVLRVRYKEHTFLFMGDASETVENELLYTHREGLKADILKVGHHGADSSSGEVFLSAVMPQYALISCAANNEYGFPHMGVLARLTSVGAKVYRTDVDGTVVFRARDGEISLIKED